MFVDGCNEGPWVRRFRDLVELHVNDLGTRDGLSEAQRSLCRRAATLEIELESLEGQLSKGERVDLKLYRELTGTLARTLGDLGIERRAKPVEVSAIAEHFAKPYVRSKP